MDAFAMNHGLGHLPSFQQGPISKDPHRLNPLTFTRKCLSAPPSISSSQHSGTKPQSHGDCENTNSPHRPLPLSSPLYQALNGPACHRQHEYRLCNVWTGCRKCSKQILHQQRPQIRRGNNINYELLCCVRLN